MNYECLIRNYTNSCSFESLIKKYKDKSEEVYFGVDNPLRNGLIYHLEIVKELITSAREKDPKIGGFALIDICQDEFDKIAKVIEDSFNVEKCAIGFQNIINAACFPQVYNMNIAGNNDDSSKMRIKLDDIIETKNGFRYKNGKGIYYAICIGLQFFYDNEFTVQDIACILVHELGHAMQHVVHDINSSYAITYWTSVMRAIELGFLFKVNLNAKTQKILNLIKKTHMAKDYDKLSSLGKELLDETKPEELIDFNKLDSHELTAISNDETPVDGSDRDTIPKKRNIFLRTIVGILKAPLSIVFGIFLIPMILYYKYYLKYKSPNIMKHDEMTADAFEVFYGFGAESGEVSRKLNKYCVNRGDQGLINYVPLLNLWKVRSDIKLEYIKMIFGYPSDKQRIVNAYINCEFELKNNKDLSAEAKKELQSQIDEIKESYNKYVKDESKAGFIYKIASIIGANTLEKAAQKDPSLRESVLEPLMKKRDSGKFK
jgi:hypothetical protein